MANPKEDVHRSIIFAIDYYLQPWMSSISTGFIALYVDDDDDDVVQASGKSLTFSE